MIARRGSAHSRLHAAALGRPWMSVVDGDATVRADRLV